MRTVWIGVVVFVAIIWFAEYAYRPKNCIGYKYVHRIRIDHSGLTSGTVDDFPIIVQPSRWVGRDGCWCFAADEQGRTPLEVDNPYSIHWLQPTLSKSYFRYITSEIRNWWRRDAGDVPVQVYISISADKDTEFYMFTN